jgi:transcriptional regulator
MSLISKFITFYLMYIPKFFAETDEEKLVEFMREFNFAALITAENDVPFATHLPFIIEQRNNKIYLLAHLAKANPHWQQFENKQVLVIFAEPHAYISPLHYEKTENVPTWNYIAVHAYGNIKTFSQAENLVLLEKQVEAFDKNYFETNWQKISGEYKTNLAKGVVAFEIEVTDLQGKKKLNQNKPGKDTQNVIEAFEKSDNANEQLIAEYMKEVHQ